jgi:hypothetical protein
MGVRFLSSFEIFCEFSETNRTELADVLGNASSVILSMLVDELGRRSTDQNNRMALDEIPVRSSCQSRKR